jgi:hypothetical protein
MLVEGAIVHRNARFSVTIVERIAPQFLIPRELKVDE